MTPDVNLLVAAFRGDHSRHPIARNWLTEAREACSEGRHSLVLLPMVVTSFLRLVTNNRVFTNPDTIADALAFLDAVVDSPGVELGVCGTEWPTLRTTLLRLGLKGNLVTDAWIAAAVQASSEHVVTFDRDFVRLLPARDVTILELSPSSRSPNIILQPRSHGLPRKPRHHSRFGRFAINIYK